MPDSQLPTPWGPAYDERDLDALLSGESRGTPAALQPVESTLAALRAAATRRELSDEAAARAAFRAFATAPAAWPASAPPLPPGPRKPVASGPHAALASGPQTVVTAHTLILAAADERTQPPARHRHRRRAAASGRRRRGLALTGAAGAALIVVAAVVTGALTGSIGELTSFGRKPASASASALATGRAPGSQGLLATGAARDGNASQSSKPTQTPPAAGPPSPHPTPDPAALCRQYFTYLMHPSPSPSGRTAWVNLRGELGKLAGDPSKIDVYCLRYLVSPLGVKDGWPAFGAGGGGQPNAGGSATQQGQSDDPAAAGRP